MCLRLRTLQWKQYHMVDAQAIHAVDKLVHC